MFECCIYIIKRNLYTRERDLPVAPSSQFMALINCLPKDWRQGRMHTSPLRLSVCM